MQICCGGMCVPVTAIWPLLIFALKYVYDRIGRLVGRKKTLSEEQCACIDDLPESVDVPTVTSMEDWSQRLENASKAGKPVIVDFGAVWCGPCKKIAPFYGQLAAKYGSEAEFVKADVDDNADLATEANVLSVPTFQVYVDKLPVDQIVGSGRSELQQFVMSHLSGASK